MTNILDLIYESVANASDDERVDIAILQAWAAPLTIVDYGEIAIPQGGEGILSHEIGYALVDKIKSFYDSVSPADIEAFKASSTRTMSNIKPSDKHGYVYVFQSEYGYKIGYSINPERRLQEIQKSMPLAINLFCTIEHDNPIELEQELHDHFAEKRMNGEWFNLTEDDLQYILDTWA